MKSMCHAFIFHPRVTGGLYFSLVFKPTALTLIMHPFSNAHHLFTAGVLTFRSILNTLMLPNEEGN